MVAKDNQLPEIFIFTITDRAIFLPTDWSRAMVNKNTDYGNDVVMAQIFFFFSSALITKKLC